MKGRPINSHCFFHEKSICFLNPDILELSWHWINWIVHLDMMDSEEKMSCTLRSSWTRRRRSSWQPPPSRAHRDGDVSGEQLLWKWKLSRLAAPACWSASRQTSWQAKDSVICQRELFWSTRHGVRSSRYGQFRPSLSPLEPIHVEENSTAELTDCVDRKKVEVVQMLTMLTGRLGWRTGPSDCRPTGQLRWNT